jgi:hypothetical protein
LAPTLAKITAIGTHIFYRWPGTWGKRLAFTQIYAGEASAKSVESVALTVPIDDEVTVQLADARAPDPLIGAAPSPLRDSLARPAPIRADEVPRELVADRDSSSLKVDRFGGIPGSEN